MPRPRTTVRQIRNVLRLVLRDNVSRRTAALSLLVSRSSVNDLVTRALAAEVTWEVASGLDDTELVAIALRLPSLAQRRAVARRRAHPLCTPTLVVPVEW